MKNLITTVLLLSAIGFSSISYADWSHSYNTFTKTYIVTDGKNSIQYETEKSAKKAAKLLNKNKKKVDKKSNGFWNEQYCANPLNEC